MRLTGEQKHQRRICFATWELKHFSPGGIGVLIHNILKTYAPDERCRLSVLWYGGRHLTKGVFVRLYPDCDFFSADEYAQHGLENASLPSQANFACEAQWRSLYLMLALKEIEERHGPFDVIEFPDFDGAAFATFQEKKLGRAFANTTIAVRIHSTESILRRYDHRPISPTNAMRAALERKALADADVVIAHLRPIVAAVRDAYGFGADWVNKVRVETPPVLVDAVAAEQRAQISETTPIVLTSKIQWFKRPEVFINGVVAFMRANQDYRGSALLMTHVIDEELRLHCQSLIPGALKDRIAFHSAVSGAARERLIGPSIVVAPSSYESFCLAAYEASRLGANVVLNGRNPAFASDTPWEDGINCWKYDGTARSLASTLSQIWRSRAHANLTTVEAPHARDPYWLSTVSPLGVDDGRRGLSFILLVDDEFSDPIESLAALPRGGELDLQLVIVTELSEGDPRRAALLNRVRAAAAVSRGTVKFAELGFRGGEASLANLGLSLADREHVAFARAGFVFDPAFLVSAVTALRRNPEFDFVLPQVVFLRGEQRSFRPFVLGEALSAATATNLFGEIEFVARRAAVAAIAFDEDLDRFVDMDFHIRACAAGMRYLVSNRVEVRADDERPARARFWRSHFDSVLSKHLVSLGAVKVTLTSIYEGSPAASQTTEYGEPALVGPASNFAGGLRFSKRSLDYYLREGTPWWRVALTRPNKIRRWLLLREFQIAKREAHNSLSDRQ